MSPASISQLILSLIPGMINWLSNPQLHTAFISRRPSSLSFRWHDLNDKPVSAASSTTDRGLPDKSPKTDFTIPYLPSESISKSEHEKTVQMKTEFSAAKTRDFNSDFLGLRSYKATAMHHGKWQRVFKPGTPRNTGTTRNTNPVTPNLKVLFCFPITYTDHVKNKM